MPGELLTTLAARLAVETDPRVWQEWIHLLNPLEVPLARRLAHGALAQGREELVRPACDWLAEHPDPADIEPLLKALDQATLVVRPRVAETLGKHVDPRVQTRLQTLLASNDKALRLAAARGLVVSEPDKALAALERLAWDLDPALARGAVSALATMKDPEAIRIMIGLLDRGEGVGLSALEALSKMSTAPPSLGTESTTDTRTRIAAWKRWWNEQPRAQP